MKEGILDSGRGLRAPAKRHAMVHQWAEKVYALLSYERYGTTCTEKKRRTVGHSRMR